MKVLRLTIKKKWYDMILSGEKKEEYREIKPHWVSRLFDVNCIGGGWGASDVCREFIQYNNSSDLFDFLKYFDAVEFINGYAWHSPRFTIKLKSITIGKAKPQWSDNWQGDVFVIKLGKIIKK